MPVRGTKGIALVFSISLFSIGLGACAAESPPPSSAADAQVQSPVSKAPSPGPGPPARKLSGDAPKIPPGAWKKGSLRVKCLLDTDGTLKKCAVVQSLSPEMDQAVLDAVATWRFTPPESKGSVPIYYTFPFTFRDPQ